MHIVTAIVQAPVTNNVGEDLLLEPGDACFIRESDVERYRLHPAVYTITEVAPTGLSTDANNNTVLRGADGEVAFRSVGSYTWANRPAAADNTGVTIRITDIGGTAGSRWISDGTYWKPESGRVVLGSTGLGASIAGTSAVETVLGSAVIPAGCMGTNGLLSIVTTWGVANSANTKTLRVRFGNSDLTGDQIWSSPQTTIGGVRAWTELQNRNSASSQVCGTAQNNSLLAGGTAPAIFTTAKNTLVAQNIVITGLRDAASAAASENLTLERYLIELIVP